MWRFYEMKRVTLLVLLLTLGVSVLWACQVPVFRYALERWSADRYRVVIMHRSDLSEEAKQVIKSLEAAMHDEERLANLELRTIDLRDAQPPEWQQFAEDQYKSENPTMFLLYPYGAFKDRPVWQGELSEVHVNRMVNSPVRQQAIRNILDGVSGNWVLVESGNSEKDNQAVEALSGFLEDVKEELELPEGVVKRDEAEETFAENPFLDPENVLDSEIPLKIDFSIVRVDRNDPEEQIFLSTLLNMEDDLGDYVEEPMLFPVFGRGRALPPIIGAGITEENVWDYCTYLCGACSCEVKRENPGIDLVFAVNWDGLLEGNQMIIDKALPPLVGVEDLLSADEPIGNPASTNPVSQEEQGEVAGEVTGPGMAESLIIVLGVLVVAVVAGTLVLMRRSA